MGKFKTSCGLAAVLLVVAAPCAHAVGAARTQDTGCNLRVFKRDLVETFLPFNGMHRFLPILAQSSGATVKEVAVTHHPRIAGQSKYGLWNRLGRGIYDLIGVGWFQKRQLRKTPAIEYTENAEVSLAVKVAERT